MATNKLHEYLCTEKENGRANSGSQSDDCPIRFRMFPHYFRAIIPRGRLALKFEIGNRRYLRKLFENVGLYGTTLGRKVCHSKHSPAKDNVSSAGASNTNSITNQWNGTCIPHEPPLQQPTQPTDNREQSSNLRNELSTPNTTVQYFAPAEGPLLWQTGREKPFLVDYFTTHRKGHTPLVTPVIASMNSHCVCNSLKLLRSPDSSNWWGM